MGRQLRRQLKGLWSRPGKDSGDRRGTPATVLSGQFGESGAPGTTTLESQTGVVDSGAEEARRDRFGRQTG